jgi:hypothetical protein
MDQKLEIAKIEGINEVEPAIFEIVAILQDGSRAILRMNAFALQALANYVKGKSRHASQDQNA